MSSPLVEFRGVGVVFARRLRALRDVTLAIAPGTIVGLVGESGSGKTTLCRTLLGLARPSEGQVLFDGADITGVLADNATQFRRQVQMLLQDAVASLSPRMTIRRAVEEPLRIHGLNLAEGRARIARLFSRLALPAALMDKYPHQISGGQARRVGVARALVIQPRLIIADEPTAGLDVSVQGDLLNLLLDLKHDFGLTYLLVSHNLNVVRRVADRVAVMYLGEIVEEAAAGPLFRRPAHPYSAALLSTNPSVSLARRRRHIVLQGEIPSVLHPPPGCRFHTRCPAAQPRCSQDHPALTALAEGRSVRCHFPFSLTLGNAAA
jgi:peptide/nickel transport system ATP-binding protein